MGKYRKRIAKLYLIVATPLSLMGIYKVSPGLFIMLVGFVLIVSVFFGFILAIETLRGD